MLGTLSIFDDGVEIELAGRNERRLVGLLALSSGRVCQRRDVAYNLWPDVDFEVSGNRLRTTLVALRKAVGDRDFIESTASTLRLVGSVETDLDAVRRTLERVRLTSESRVLANLYHELIESLRPGLLPDIHDEWIHGFQDHWSNLLQDVLHKAAELEFDHEQFERASELAELATSRQLDDATAWEMYLRAMAKLGQGREAHRKFTAARKRVRLEGWIEFEPSLVQLAKEVRDGDHATNPALWPLPPGGDSVLVRSFQRLAQLDSGLAAQFVASDAFRLEAFRSPEPSLGIAESLVETLPERDPNRPAVLLMTMRIHSLLHNSERVVELGNGLPTENLSPAQQRLALTITSFAYFQMRQFDVAIRLVDQALEIAKSHLKPYQIQLTHADKAHYLWYSGDHDAAIATFESVLKEIADEPEPLVSYAPALLHGNIGAIYAQIGRLGEAIEWLEKGFSLASAGRYREQIHQIEAPMGYALIALGRHIEGRKALLSALTHCFRTRNQRALALGLDYTAAALLQLKKAHLADALFDWADGFRSTISHQRTRPEAAFADHQRAKARTLSHGSGLRLKANDERAALEVIFEAMSDTGK
ncbi:MAG TPA: hypothetical protein PKA27_15520 [Fimbriimonadaceae bacterium]|mgnify:CR=1 FL=1|nr:hypothetical protein [Fimbriimonadaceae bacterium]